MQTARSGPTPREAPPPTPRQQHADHVRHPWGVPRHVLPFPGLCRGRARTRQGGIDAEGKVPGPGTFCFWISDWKFPTPRIDEKVTLCYNSVINFCIRSKIKNPRGHCVNLFPVLQVTAAVCVLTQAQIRGEGVGAGGLGRQRDSPGQRTARRPCPPGKTCFCRSPSDLVPWPRGRAPSLGACSSVLRTEAWGAEG